jgi:hypothetical protein
MRYYIIYIMHVVGFINLLIVTGNLYRGKQGHRHSWFHNLFPIFQITNQLTEYIKG